MNRPQMIDFLSSHSSPEKVASIRTEPKPIFLEEGRDANFLNFDFILRGLTKKNLHLRFIKAAVYDNANNLVHYKYLNHNAVGIPGIYTIGKIDINGADEFDIPNPFYRFPKDMPIEYIRYMFTFVDQQTRDEYYYGNILVKPQIYDQQSELQVPLYGMMTILDGHDYYSHHRRFEMTFVRDITAHRFVSNFSRYALDFVILGEDGNLSQLETGTHHQNHDFHFMDVRHFYTHGVSVYAPGDGVVVDVVNHLDDLYERSFDFDGAVKNNRIRDLAGNYVIIQHNSAEFSHLFHLLKGSIRVSDGQQVQAGEKIGRIGFSGAANLYSHLHYQLMNGKK